ncbi:MAG: phage tail tube protein [Bryobacteraceae bacterium]
MSCYIASNNNRFYAAAEEIYGVAPAIGAQNRIPAVKLAVKQVLEKPERKDKTGTRTFSGYPSRLRKQTSFELRTYMTGWSDQAQEPSYGPLFEAALGGACRLYGGGTATAGGDGRTLVFEGPHGLSVGQAVSFGGEIRFVAAFIDAQTVLLNAPFSVMPGPGSALGKTATYFAAEGLRSASIFDYWTPASAVQRIVYGAGMDKLQVRVNGDYHEFRFTGMAKDLADSATFESGQAGLESFPPEPEQAGFDYSIIPGHLGQAWLGPMAERFFTITSAEVTLDNDLDMRASEFGALTPRCLVPGTRKVTVDFSLYGRDDEATVALYQAARQQSPIEVMFQLGETPGQLFGMYLKSVIPEPPEFDDDETKLEWHFRGCRAQGTVGDELVVAFG